MLCKDCDTQMRTSVSAERKRSRASMECACLWRGPELGSWSSSHMLGVRGIGTLLVSDLVSTTRQDVSWVEARSGLQQQSSHTGGFAGMAAAH